MAPSVSLKRIWVTTTMNMDIKFTTSQWLKSKDFIYCGLVLSDFPWRNDLHGKRTDPRSAGANLKSSPLLSV